MEMIKTIVILSFCECETLEMRKETCKKVKQQIWKALILSDRILIRCLWKNWLQNK